MLCDYSQINVPQGILKCILCPVEGNTMQM